MGKKVSVIISVYNGQAYIRESILSILNQTMPPYELIIVNDGSTDGTACVVSELIQKNRSNVKIKLFSQQNNGVGCGLNQGVALALGEFLAFNDADDLWVNNKLEKQVNFLTTHLEIDMVFGLVKQFYSPELTDDEKNKIYCPSEIAEGICLPALCIKRSILMQLGNFDKTQKTLSFMDLFSKSQLQGISYYVLDDLVLHRRLHKKNISQTKREENKRVFAMLLKKRIDHIRKGQPC